MLSLSVWLVTFCPYFLEWRSSEAWGEMLRKNPNASIRTVLRPSDDNYDADSNDDDDSNDDRVGAVVEQFGRTEEQIY